MLRGAAPGASVSMTACLPVARSANISSSARARVPTAGHLQPHGLNVREDFLSQASERTQHAYRLLPTTCRLSPAGSTSGGDHTVSTMWRDENNWLFPPSRTLPARSPLRPRYADRAFRRVGRRWVAGVTGLVRLGPPQSCLSLPGDCRSLIKSCELIALRLDGRALSLSGDVA